MSARDNSRLLGILYATSFIKDFEFDQKKFLNGLAEDEFVDITRKLKTENDFKQTPLPYQALIQELRRQETAEEYKHRDRSFLGSKEKVTFQMQVAVIQYDSSLEQLVRKYHQKSICLGPQASYGFSFINLDLGSRTVSTPSISGGKVLYRDVRHASLLDPKLHDALFRSVYHSDSVRPPLTTLAYEIAIVQYSVKNGSARYTGEEQFDLEIKTGGKKNRATFDLGKLTFFVEAEIQYCFTPCLGDFEILEIFGFRTQHHTRIDKNMLEPFPSRKKRA